MCSWWGCPPTCSAPVLSDAHAAVRPWIPVVSLTKGLEQGTLLRMTQIIEEVLPGHPAAALTGPNLAREIAGGQAAASVIATEDPSVATALQSILRSALFRVYMNHDVIGCEIGGALKNVIAIASGIAQGLNVGDNTRAAVITRGLAELTRLGVAMGGRRVDPVRPGRNGRSDGDGHEPAQPEPLRRRATGPGPGPRLTSWPR